MNKEVKKLVRDLMAQGWDVDDTRRSGHIRAAAPDGALVFFASTPSNNRTIKNTVSQLKRYGYRPGGRA